jgi:hypothetical protein
MHIKSNNKKNNIFKDQFERVWALRVYYRG